MLTFTVTQGVLNPPEVVALIARAEHGGYADAAGQFDDAPALACTLWPGDDRASVGTLEATWRDAEKALVRIDFTPATIDALDPGWVKAVVTVAATDLAVAEFSIKVQPGPGLRSARPVYCTYMDLEDELPWIDDIRSEDKDQSGFTEARAEARDWIDSCIAASVPTPRGRGIRSYENYWTWGDGSDLARRYADAVAADSLDLTSASGRRIVKAAVYRSLSRILQRCVGAEGTAGRDLIGLAERYAVQAEREIICCTASFAGTSLRPLNLGVSRGGR